MRISLGIAILAVALPVVADVYTGYATAIYHNGGDSRSRIVHGRQVECTLRDVSRAETQDCAMDWCEEWCVKENGNPTCICRIGRTADAKARGQITEVDDAVQRYTYRRK